MKFRTFIAIFLLAALPALANAASPLQEYLQARQIAIAAIPKSPPDDPAVLRKMRHAQALLEALVGPIDVKGFPAKAEVMNVGSEDDDAYWSLDRAYARAFDGKTTLHMTTVPIFQAWWARYAATFKNKPDLELAAVSALASSQNSPQKKPRLGQTGLTAAISSLRANLGTEGFYAGTGILSETGAAVYGYAELPVKVTGRGALARALLFEFTQDGVDGPPHWMAVAVLQGERIYVLVEKVSVPDAVCKASCMHDGINECSEQEMTKFQQCYVQDLSKQPQYLQWVKQAQDLVDRVPVASSR